MRLHCAVGAASFPYYQIQSADVIQNHAWRRTIALIVRRWRCMRLCELTSSRYLLGLGRGGRRIWIPFMVRKACSMNACILAWAKERGRKCGGGGCAGDCLNKRAVGVDDFKKALPRAGLYANGAVGWRMGRCWRPCRRRPGIRIGRC